jgi:hypothetical protein
MSENKYNPTEDSPDEITFVHFSFTVICIGPSSVGSAKHGCNSIIQIIKMDRINDLILYPPQIQVQ